MIICLVIIATVRDYLVETQGKGMRSLFLLYKQISFMENCKIVFTELFQLDSGVRLRHNARIFFAGNYSERIIMSFSLRRTIKALLKEATDAADITCIHGIRALTTITLYVAHQLIAISRIPFSNRTSLTEVRLSRGKPPLGL